MGERERERERGGQDGERIGERSRQGKGKKGKKKRKRKKKEGESARSRERPTSVRRIMTNATFHLLVALPVQVAFKRRSSIPRDFSKEESLPG